MASVKAIELKGIVHNTTKIGVQDGQAEDIVNLRFKDGAWRSTGDGKLILEGIEDYSQLFIHTNVYRHLLGVSDGELCWIATADADDPNDFVMNSPTKKICDVVGNVTITQTGHLITVIDEADDFEFFVYKTNVGEYIEGKIDVNGNPFDRTLFPFDMVHFNLTQDSSECNDLEYLDSDKVVYETGDIGIIAHEGTAPYYEADKETAVNLTRTAIAHATDKNLFTRPFLVCAAIELYDGSYVYASAPVLMFPNEAVARQDRYVNESGNVVTFVPTDDDRLSFGMREIPNSLSGAKYASVQVFSCHEDEREGVRRYSSTLLSHNLASNGVVFPSFVAGCNVSEGEGTTQWHTLVIGSGLHVSLENCNLIDNNDEIFSSLCIFVSQEAEYIDWSSVRTAAQTNGNSNGLPMFYKNRSVEDITYDLMHSQMYILKRYTKKEISELKNNGIVNLTGRIDEGVLKSINEGTCAEYLTSESISRLTYLPEYAYSYNGRLHIANYKTTQFHGFPIELFTNNNHSVKFNKGTTTPYLGIKDLESDNDSILHWNRGVLNVYSDTTLVNKNAPSVFAIVEIETDNGIQKVCRYIPAKSGIEIEDMDALVCYPDYRATKMDIYYVYPNLPFYSLKHKQLTLKSHPFLNMAYYMSSDMKPIKWSSFSVEIEEEMQDVVN